jgi:hypothetical protein
VRIDLAYSLSSSRPSFGVTQLLCNPTCLMKFGEELIVFQKGF